MHRLRNPLAVVVFTAAFCGVVSAVTRHQADSPRTNELAGKAVIVEQRGVYYGVLENVGFRTAGRDSTFLQLRLTSPDGTEYEHWLPLEKVDALKVFDQLEDAIKYDKRMHPGQYDD